MIRKKTILTALLCFGIFTGCEDVLIEDLDIEDINSIESIENTEEIIETAELLKVVDGDTIKVYLDGEKYTIRMVGIDTPESVHPDESRNTIYGEKASDYAKTVFSEGQTVYLSRDVSDKDQYNRLLRYVWLEKPTDTHDETEIREKMYNAKVLLDGYANTYEYPPDDTLYTLFSTFESEAAQQNKGLWAENGLNTENIIRQQSEESSVFVGNKNSKKLHSIYCENLPQEQNRVYFESKEEAIEEGYEIDTKCMK